MRLRGNSALISKGLRHAGLAGLAGAHARQFSPDFKGIETPMMSISSHTLVCGNSALISKGLRLFAQSKLIEHFCGNSALISKGLRQVENHCLRAHVCGNSALISKGLRRFRPLNMNMQTERQFSPDFKGIETHLLRVPAHGVLGGNSALISKGLRL